MKPTAPMVVFVVVSAMVVLGILYLGTMDSVPDALWGIFGIIMTKFVTSVDYLVGSSAGSARKDEKLQPPV